MTVAPRMLLLFTAAAVLPSCGHPYRHDWVHITVHNDGDQDADVFSDVEYGSWSSWEDHLSWSAPAGDTSEFPINLDNLSRLRIRINRSADHVEIFRESWDRNELEDLDLHVTITIHP